MEKISGERMSPWPFTVDRVKPETTPWGEKMMAVEGVGLVKDPRNAKAPKRGRYWKGLICVSVVA